MKVKTRDELIEEIEFITSQFKDTFRHNKVIPALQEWREERIARLETCIKQLRDASQKEQRG